MYVNDYKHNFTVAPSHFKTPLVSTHGAVGGICITERKDLCVCAL